MINTFSYINSSNHTIDQHIILDDKLKKKQYNDTYQQKRKHAIDTLNAIKSVLGTTDVNPNLIRDKLLEKDTIITNLQNQYNKIHDEYTHLLRDKDAEILKLRFDHDRLLLDTSRYTLLSDVGQHLALMNDRIGKLEVCENRVNQLHHKANTHEAWYFFLKQLNDFYPAVVDDVFLRLQNKRLSKPLDPPSLDKLVADSTAIVSVCVPSPAPILRS
jgi:hypothetical protein